ncbi:MAG: glycosyltransferase family 4 protein [bacterium]
MIYLIFPVGSFHGWGVCGKYLTRELSSITDTKLITHSVNEAEISDPLDYEFLKSKFVGFEETKRFITGSKIIDMPVLQAIAGPMNPWLIETKTSFKVGYTFFEDNLLSESYVANASKNFDYVVAGSKWCEEILESYGCTNAKTVIQGVDTQIFNPFDNEKKYFKDKFIIFSGGKFELRKSQDLVIRAFKILQDKYDDVMLLTNWYNKWPHSFNTMAVTPHIKFSGLAENNYNHTINKILTDNGIDLRRVISVPPVPNTSLARIYKNTDIGLFPNRCEGGTNLVLMEYMACGKPTIASYNSGHKDILTSENSIKIEEMKQIKINKERRDVAVWDEPNLDEIISHLEWAYNNRESLKLIGNKAGEDLCQTTWAKSAENFYKLFNL